MLQTRLEEASLNSWPALQQILFDGWILRFAKGYTKRANSVNVIHESVLDLDAKVVACEKAYREKGLPPIFRITSINEPPGLDRLLEGRGYRLVDPCRLLCLDLNAWRCPPVAAVEVRDDDLKTWLDSYGRLNGSSREKQRIHGEILRAIPSRPYPVSLVVSRRVAACGLGVLENGYFGLFDLFTTPKERNKGYGTSLIAGLLSRAIGEKASYAYLQVFDSNTSARRLYERIGFRESYQYWYRVGDA